MNHQELFELLSAFVDNELTEAERSTVKQHIDSCPDCRRRLGQLETLKHSVHEAGNMELPYAFASTLTRSIQHNDDVAISWLGIEHYALRFVFGLAFLVLVLLGITSYRQADDPLTVERYVSGISSDSAVAQILTKKGTLTKDDVMFAVLTK